MNSILWFEPSNWSLPDPTPETVWHFGIEIQTSENGSMEFWPGGYKGWDFEFNRPVDTSVEFRLKAENLKFNAGSYLLPKTYFAGDRIRDSSAHHKSVCIKFGGAVYLDGVLALSGDNLPEWTDFPGGGDWPSMEWDAGQRGGYLDMKKVDFEVAYSGDNLPSADGQALYKEELSVNLLGVVPGEYDGGLRISGYNAPATTEMTGTKNSENAGWQSYLSTELPDAICFKRDREHSLYATYTTTNRLFRGIYTAQSAIYNQWKAYLNGDMLGVLTESNPVSTPPIRQKVSPW